MGGPPNTSTGNRRGCLLILKPGTVERIYLSQAFSAITVPPICRDGSREQGYDI